MIRKSPTLFILLFTLIAVIGVYLLFFLKETPTVKKQNTKVYSNIEEGKKLSATHCSSCHAYPRPALLPKHVWREETLPHMGPHLGIFEHAGNTYPTEQTPHLPDNYYPSEQQLSNDEWAKIIDYYSFSAPEKLNGYNRSSDISVDSTFFRARTPGYRGQTPPMVSSIRFDPANRLIYLSDAGRSMFYVFDQDLNFKDRYRLTSAISDIRFTNDVSAAGKRELLTTYIGDVNPSDAPDGFIQMVWYDPRTEQGGAGEMLIDSLARPVESQFIDLDQDGSKDLLVSEFGHRTGEFFWVRNSEYGLTPTRQTLIDVPGCIQSHVVDYTGNGRPDIFALCSQLDQSIYLLKNKGEGHFERERLIQFPITAGSSSFELHDFNQDGHLDILYTSGDNADYSITYKPYHGLYIYLNDGRENFTEKWFYPMNGAYKTAVRDFDRDGYPDIAAISYFANYEQKPEASFLIFKGEQGLNFKPYYHPAGSAGRWITMDVADWTGDGYEDIVLANFSRGPTEVANSIQTKWMDGPHFLLLENRGEP